MEFGNEFVAARDIVKHAIEHGAIKLVGPVSSNQAVGNAEADAAYLIALLEALTKALPRK